MFSGSGAYAKAPPRKTIFPQGFIDYSQNPWVKSGQAGLQML